MSEVLANLATTTLSANMTSGALSCTVTSGTAFPSTGNFRVRIGNEIIIVGARSGNTLSSLTRGAEGSSAASHVIGDLTKMVLTRDGLTTFVQENAGAVGAILATLDTMDQIDADALVAISATGRALIQGDAAAALSTIGAQAAATAATDAELLVAKRNAVETSHTGTKTLTTADLGTTTDATAALTITVPSGLATAVGDWFQVRRSSSGAVTINRGGSVEFFAPGSTVAKTSIASDYVNQTLKFTCRNLGTSGANDWVVEGVADPGLTKIYEAALDPDDYGASATPGFNNDTAFAAVTAAAKVASDNGRTAEIVIKQGKEYEFSTTWQFDHRTTLLREGDLRFTGTFAAGSCALLWKNGTGTPSQGQEGGMTGAGRLFCQRRVADAVKADCWRGGIWEQGVILDPVDQAFRFINTGTGADCDSNRVENVRLAVDTVTTGWPTEVGVPVESKRPKGFVTFDGTGTKIVSDSKVVSCFCAGGLFPETAAGAGDGAIGATVIDASRIRFEGCEWYSHWNRPTSGGQNSLWTAGYLFRSVTKDVSRNVIVDPYLEAAVQAVDGTTDPLWEWSIVKLQLAAGGPDRVIERNHILGAAADCSATAALKHATWMFCNTPTATRKIINNYWLRPRGPFANVLGNAGAHVLSDGCERNRIEVMEDIEATPTPRWTVAGVAGATTGARENRIVSLSGTAASKVA